MPPMTTGCCRDACESSARGDQRNTKRKRKQRVRPQPTQRQPEPSGKNMNHTQPLPHRPPMSQHQHRTPSTPLSQLLTQRPLLAIPTSIPSLDLSLHGGLVPGQLYEVYGLSNTGKLTLASQLCLNALRQDKRVLWITMTQTLPISTLSTLDAHNLVNAERVTHHRITTLGALYIFLKKLQEPYGLIIIDDFATALSRSMGELEEVIIKPKQSIETRKHRTILGFVKLLNTHCARNKSSCILFNAVDTFGMSFIDTSQTPPPLMSMHPSSQLFHNTRPKPKKYYQQILISGLGDHSSWNGYFRARIMLYMDWAVSGTETAVFAHIKHSPAMRKVLQAKGVKQRVVNFKVTKMGLRPVMESIVSQRADFTIDEKDLESEEEEEEEEHVVEAIDESGLPPSSPANDIQNARELLSSQLTQSGRPDVMDKEVLQELETELDGMAEEEEPMEKSTENHQSDDTPTPQKTTQDDLKDITFSDPFTEDAQTPRDGVDKVSEDQVPELIQTSALSSTKEPPSQEKPDDEFASMLLDTSLEIQEIEDELEELYPSQPEAIDITRLSQLQSTLTRQKRSHTTPKDMGSTKRPRLPLVDIANFEDDSADKDNGNSTVGDSIPATFPFF